MTFIVKVFVLHLYLYIKLYISLYSVADVRRRAFIELCIKSADFVKWMEINKKW